MDYTQTDFSEQKPFAGKVEVFILKKEEDQEIQMIIHAFRGAIERRRLLVKKPFQDFDRTRSSHITIDQVI